MKSNQIIERVNSLTNHCPMQFSCFHDGMFVYDFVMPDSEVLEFTFFPKESAILVDSDFIEDIITQVDLSKYHKLSFTADIDQIDISSIL